MAKLIVDTIQRPGSTGLLFPLADGAAGSYVTTNGTGQMGFGAAQSFPAAPAPASFGPDLTNTNRIVGSIVTHTDRQNVYSTGEWASSGPWTTYTNRDAHQDNNLIQFVNMALGDGFGAGGTTNNFIGGDSESELGRQLEFSAGNRLGYDRDFKHWDNITGQAGHSFRIMPLRNNSGAAITVAISAYVSDYWEQGTEGSCLFVLTPNTSTYSTVTSVASTRLSFTNTNTTKSRLSGDVSIPANTTVLVCLASTDRYMTTYRFQDCNYFDRLSTMLTNSNIRCDLRMLSSLYQSRFNLPSTGAASSALAALWTQTATNYGDR